MDRIATLNNCIVTLGSINVRVDQMYTVNQPIVEVIQTLVNVVQDMKKEQEDADKDKQGE